MWTTTWRTAGVLTAGALAGLVLAACSGDDGPTEPTTGAAPSISSVSPDRGTESTEVRIEGMDFRSGVEVFFNDIASDSVDRVSSSEIFALAPAGVTVGTIFDVIVENADGTADTATAAFEAVEPILSFVNGASLPSGNEGSTVVLDGDAFGDLHAKDGTPIGRVLFSDGAGGTVEAEIASEDDWTNTFILTTVPGGAETGDLVVETATGVSDPIEFTVTTESTFSPSVVDWNETTPLPTGLSGHAAVFVQIEAMDGVDRYVHVTGGTSDDSLPRTEAIFAEVEGDAMLGDWITTGPLSIQRAFHASVAATPFNSRVDPEGDGWLYVLGGIEEKGGDPVSSILRAPINSDGSLGGWESAGNLPEALHSLGAVIFRSNIYIAGGARAGNEPVSSVYRAPVDSLGQIGEWEQLDPLPTARSYHELTLIGNCLHVFDGNTAAVEPETNELTDTRTFNIERARIDLRSSNLREGGWTLDDTEPPKRRYKHSALIAGGGVLRTAGLYDGIGQVGSSENMFAQIGSDCDVADFSGANNANSIRSKGGANLFNHGAVSFVDADGVAHVMIIGGDDVDNPGEKRTEVWVF